MSRSKDFFIPRWPNKDKKTGTRRDMTYDFLINDKKKKVEKPSAMKWFYCEDCEDDFRATDKKKYCKWCDGRNFRPRTDEDVKKMNELI